MDILFNRRRAYLVNDSIEDARDNIQSIVSKKWFDFSNNITGRMTYNGNYVFTYKWSIGGFGAIEYMPAYLNVKLRKENDKTKIETRVRPNSALVISFYIVAILFLGGAFGIITFLEGPKIFILLFLPFFNLLLFELMQLFTNGLRKRFEKILQLQKDV